MINITKKELKKASIGFRTLANRLIGCHYYECGSIVKRFIDFVDNCPIIFDYIQDCINSAALECDIATEVQTVAHSYGRAIFDFPSNTKEEVAFTYQLLKYFSQDDKLYLSCAGSYSSSSKYQDHIKEFHDRIVYPFVQDIETFLNEISIDMGYDEDVKFVITVNGGQVNIAKDNSTINAIQNNGIDINQLDCLLQAIINSYPQEKSPEDKEAIEESVDVIKEELQNENPKKSLIKTALSSLEHIIPTVKETAEFSAAVVALIQFVQPLIH